MVRQLRALLSQALAPPYYPPAMTEIKPQNAAGPAPAPAVGAPIVILVNPQLGENIGTAARAMANFALDELRLVNPRDGWPSDKALGAAAGASRVIEAARVFPDCPAAIGDLNCVYATTARPRDMIKEVLSPEGAARDMKDRIAVGQKVGVMFGRERWGLENDEVALADVIITAPVNPAFASLNIAQAVLLVAYEWYKLSARSLGMGTAQSPAIERAGLRMAGTRPATRAELMGLFGHLEAELEAAGFFKSPNMRPTMVRNLHNIFTRAGLTEQEVRSLRGVIASLARAHEREK
jgi:tRNA/rRNA methyltransferase